MSLDCRQFRDLQQDAPAASRAYPGLLEDLEAAIIRHNSDVPVLSIGLKGASRRRDTAIAERTNHESACMREKPVMAAPLFSKRRSALNLVL